MKTDTSRIKQIDKRIKILYVNFEKYAGNKDKQNEILDEIAKLALERIELCLQA
jgi:hypothetical protein